MSGAKLFQKAHLEQAYSFSLKGYGGLLIGLEEGLEVNVLGLTAGIDLYPPALKLPAVGRIGFSDYRRFDEADFLIR